MEQSEKDKLKLFALKSLVEISNNSDIELRHIQADQLLCFVLNRLGFKSVVDAYNIIDK